MLLIDSLTFKVNFVFIITSSMLVKRRLDMVQKSGFKFEFYMTRNWNILCCILLNARTGEF